MRGRTKSFIRLVRQSQYFFPSSQGSPRSMMNTSLKRQFQGWESINSYIRDYTSVQFYSISYYMLLDLGIRLLVSSFLPNHFLQDLYIRVRTGLRPNLYPIPNEVRTSLFESLRRYTRKLFHALFLKIFPKFLL